MKILDDLDDQSYKALLSKLNKMEFFTSSNDLLRHVKGLLNANDKLKKSSANKKIKIKSGDEVRAEMGKNRSKKGQYKLDLYNLPDAEYAKVIDAITKILT